MEDIKIGDIIVIDRFVSQGVPVAMHSFVVIEDRNGEVCSLNYDFIALLMSSFKTEALPDRHVFISQIIDNL